MAVDAGLPLDDADWKWLAQWLAEALGLAVRIVRCGDPRAAWIAPGQAAAYYGSRDFLERARVHGAKDAVQAFGEADDWLSGAWRWLRRDEAPGDTPAVATIDRGLEELVRRLEDSFGGLRRAPRWPDGHRCAVVLTHDVDAVDRWTRQHLRHLARHLRERWPREGLRSIARLPWVALRGIAPDTTAGRRLLHCIALEKDRAVRATYLFFSPDARHRKAYDGWYTPATPVGRTSTIGELWRELVRDQFDVGLHLSIGAHDDPDAIAAEWSALREASPALATYRSHHLKRRANLTERVIATLGGAVELNIVGDGFRLGTGLPFVFVDDGRPLYRIPTVIADTALEVHGARAEVRDEAWERWRAILDETRRNESLAVVLVHPENPGANDMIARLIDWARAQHAWTPTVRELMAHWEHRRPVSVLERAGC